jgi:hypothetical protein
LNIENLSTSDLKRFLRIKNMSKNELEKISARWADLDNLDRFYDADLHPDNNIEIKYYPIVDIINKGDFKELNPFKLITDHTNDMRYVHIIETWESGGYMDPPEAYSDGIKWSFTNGRHRTIAAYHIGEKCIPIAQYRPYQNYKN